MSDRELLQRFRDTGSDAAFRALVERYAGLVFAVALRRTGNRTAAEEVAQNVFLILAAKAGNLKSQGELAGWLHRTAILEASNVVRREQTHRRKMEEMIEMTQNETPSALPNTPDLDEAIDALSDSDRKVVLLRFYDGLSYREVASATGKSEAAARQQVSRALTKLSRKLQRRGITTSAAILGTGLARQLSAAVSPGAVAGFSSAALSGASQVSSTTLLFNHIQTMAYAKTKTAAAVALLAAIPIGMQWNENQKLRMTLRQDEQAPLSEVGSGKSEHEVSPKATRGSSASRGKGANSPAETRLAHGSGAREWQRALYEQDPLKRSQLLAELLATFDASTASDIAELFFSDGGGKFTSEANLFMRAWGKLDGPAALSYLESNTRDGKQNPIALAILGGWASSNPQAARAWAEAVEDEGLRENLLFGVLDGWALVDFNAAASYAETRPRSDARTRFIDLLFKRSMADGDLSGAQNWFAGISDNDHNEIFKRRAFERIVDTMLLRDPSAAADWIASQSDGAFVSSGVIRNTASRLAASSPQDALAWLSSMSNLDGQISAQGHRTVMGQWAAQNPDEAGTWLGNNMSHPGYDAMARQYSHQVAALDSEAAMQWAQSIGDTNQRYAAEVGVARQSLAGGGRVEDLQAAGLSADQIETAKMIPAIFNSTGSRVLTAGRDSTVRLWDVESGTSFATGDFVDFGGFISGDGVLSQAREYEVAYQVQTEVANRWRDYEIQGQGMTLEITPQSGEQAALLHDLDVAAERQVESVRIEAQPSGR